MRALNLVRISGVSLALAAASFLLQAQPVPAMAQAAGMAGLAQSDTVTAQVTVTAIDQASRMVTFTGPSGDTLTMKIGEQVRNLAQVKAGDKVNVQYHRAVAYVLAPAGTKLPNDSLEGAVGGAAPGQTSAGGAMAKLVVTGLVVGVDPTTYTVQLVNPSGGMIRSVAVLSPEGRQAMNKIHVGDTITAVISEAIAVAVEPAT